MRSNKASKINDQDVFNQLLDNWAEKTLFLSGGTLEIPEAKPIIGAIKAMEKDIAISWIFSRMLSGSSDTAWYWLFLEECGVTIKLDEKEIGKVYLMELAFLRWGWENGYLNKDQIDKSYLKL